MSTMSSLAISPPTPTVYRRRAVVVEKRTGVDDKFLLSGNSPVETTRGLVASRNRGRAKPSSSSQPRPRWHRVLSAASKIAMLLAVLLWLGSTAWTSLQRARRGADLAGSDYADYEARIADVEASMQTQIKMLQQQLGVLDEKIAHEAEYASYEIMRLLETKKARLEKVLRSLTVRTDGLEKSLQELKMADMGTRNDFDDIVKEVENMVHSDYSRSTDNLDQIRALLKDLAEKEMAKHAADGLGRPDYALASAGARVVRHSLTYGFVKGGFDKAASVLCWIRDGVHCDATKMLEPSFGEPGQCFALNGSSGFVEIRLRTAIVPEAVTLEHVHKSVAFDRSSAPKECRISGWYDGPNTNISRHKHSVVSLVEFSYDLEKSNAQTFDINAAEDTIVNMIRLDFDSNHGSSPYTCIYRLRVHGHTHGTPIILDF